MEYNKNLRLLLILPIAVLLVVALYFLITTAPFVRYWADDFCAAIPLRNNGFLGAQLSWWNSWTGRFSYIFFLDIFESLGAWSARVLPLLILAGSILTLLPVFAFEIVLAPLFIILVLINTPNIIQSFYWQIGSLNYTFEFIFLNLFIALIIRFKRKFSYIFAFLLPFIAAGFSEVYALAQTVLFLFLIAIIWLIKLADKKKRLKLMVIGLIGAFVSIGVMALSPGNQARSSLVDHPENFWFVIKSTFYGTKWYLERMLTILPFDISLIFSFTTIFIVVWKNWHHFKSLYLGVNKMFLVMVISILSIVSTTAAVVFSGYYAMAYISPERAMVIVIYMFFIAFFVFSFCASILVIKLVNKKLIPFLVWIAIVSSIFASVYLSGSVIAHWAKIRGALTIYATEWDREEKVLIQAGGSREKVAEITTIKPVGDLDGFTENNGWVLGCVKEYYHLREIKLK